MLQTLELRNFRSYNSGLFEFAPGVNIIVGPNASGKTNLLEAVHVICVLRGFKAADKDLLATGSEWARLEALTDAGVRVAKFQPGSKQLEIDGVVKKRLNTQHALPVVVFEPEHMLLLSAEPERRRTYLDGILSLTEPGYHAALLAYRRAVAQRNRLLKTEGSNSERQLFAWDLQLVEKAGQLVAARLELIEQLAGVARDCYKKLSGGSEELEINYKTKLQISRYSDSLLRYLREDLELDRARGFTGAGPHRDDLDITLSGRDARTLVSRGETRTIILSLKVAELELLKQTNGRQPVLLLDDVFSELDGRRRRALAETLADYQTFLTTTDADVAVEHFSNYNIIPM